MNSFWTENLIIFVMALVSTRSDDRIKIRVFGDHSRSTLSQTRSNLVKVAKNLRETQV